MCLTLCLGKHIFSENLGPGYTQNGNTRDPYSRVLGMLKPAVRLYGFGGAAASPSTLPTSWGLSPPNRADWGAGAPQEGAGVLGAAAPPATEPRGGFTHLGMPRT